ncbi:MAG TPA: hypothetical protein VHQ47_14950 [Phycisphaerae bacterium]|nr:hypothetical protein [Phycisphaerae bacterium]
MTDNPQKVLSYTTPPRTPPTPMWKHLVFVPLLFWTIVVGVGVPALLLYNAVLYLLKILSRSR